MKKFKQDPYTAEIIKEMKGIMGQLPNKKKKVRKPQNDIMEEIRRMMPKKTLVVPTQKKEMNWRQAKMKFPQLHPLGNADGDIMPNMIDCKPFNKRRQDDFEVQRSDNTSSEGFTTHSSFTVTPQTKYKYYGTRGGIINLKHKVQPDWWYMSHIDEGIEKASKSVNQLKSYVTCTGGKFEKTYEGGYYCEYDSVGVKKGKDLNPEEVKQIEDGWWQQHDKIFNNSTTFSLHDGIVG